MDASEFDNKMLKPENSNSTPNFHYLPKFKNLFRIIEISLILVVLTSVSTRLPFAVKITGEFLRQLIGFVISPLFIFLLSNVIVLTLFFKSRHHFPEHSQISLETHLEFCQELIRNGDDHCTHFTHETSLQPEEVVFQDKETIVEVTEVFKARRRNESSENLRKDVEEDNCNCCGKQLHSLDTEKQRRRVADAGEVDELSNEEFQRAIEAFIAKQIKFHQAEEGVIVLHGRA